MYMSQVRREHESRAPPPVTGLRGPYKSEIEVDLRWK